MNVRARSACITAEQIMKTLLAASVLFISSTAPAQHAGTDQENKQQVTRLAFIVGDWAGKGWMLGRDGEKQPFTQTETIRFKLDSTAVLIEGEGRHEGAVIHDALAIITYDKGAGAYSFHSHLANGRTGKFKAELIDDRLFWYPGESMRYIIGINDQGQWYETG